METTGEGRERTDERVRGEGGKGREGKGNEGEKKEEEKMCVII